MNASGFSSQSKSDALAAARARLQARIDKAKGVPRSGAGAAPMPAPSAPPRLDSNPSAPADTDPRIAEMLTGLNPQQYKAVTHRGGHLLVVAGAGSGKTRVLTTRISYLIATGQAQPGNILAITFTNKAAKEMRERLGTMLGPVARGMWISTFHSACVRILRAQHEAIGMRSTFTIYDQSDSQRLMKMVCAEENIDTKRYTPKLLAYQMSDLKNEMITPDEFASAASSADEQVLSRAYSAYQKRLREANAVDFDDLIMLTVLMLRRNPDIAADYRRHFTKILVDEYQDTNTAQYQLIRELVGEDRRAEGSSGELTVVGDADQSIYAFRGATIRNIQDFEKDFPSATTIVLDQNYRSTQNILTAANAVIANNAGRRAKNLWTDSGEGAKLVGYVADSESDESHFVVEEIEDLHENKGYHYKDFAVFYRTNAQSRSIEDMLVRSGIPYRVVGGTKFYDRKEVKDALAYLHAIVNPDDAVSLRRIINEPRRGIGAKAEGALSAHARFWAVSFGQAVMDVADPDAAREQGRGGAQGLTPRAEAAVADFARMLAKIREQALAGAAPEDVLDAVLDESGYTDVLAQSKDPQDEGRLENLAQLRAVAVDFSAADPEATLASFLDEVSLVADSDQIPDAEAQREGEVVLMTVHTAKGLEFPVVFVTGLEDGTFPHIRSFDDEDEMAEERRLAYVALTRARERLYISRAASRSQWGAPQQMEPSRFIDEIPPEVIDWRRDEAFVEGLRSGFGSGSGWGSNSWGSSSWSNSSKSKRSYSSSSWDDDNYAPPVGSGSSKPFVPEKLGTTSTKKVEKVTADESLTSPSSSSTPETGGLKVGDAVRHKSFGKGRILGFEGVGKSTVAQVRFASGATKRLMLRFAPLEKE